MRKVLLFFIFSVLTFCAALAQNGDILFQKKLDQLKAKDSLAKWIDNRVNFALNQPKSRLGFLMETSQKIWRKPKTSQEREAWLFLLVNQGYYQLQSGDILTSINCYEQAYQFFQKHPVHLDVEEYILKPLSNNYTRLGDYERAIYIQKRSLALALQQHNYDLATSAYCNLSTSYRSKNDLENAEKSAIAGLKIADQKSDIYGLLLSNMADIKNQTGNYAVASSYNLQAIRHLKSQQANSSTAYWLLGAYTLAGDIRLNQKNYKEAKHYYGLAQKAINTLLNGNRKRELTYLLMQLGKVSLLQKNYSQALTYYNRALGILLPAFKGDKATELPEKTSLYAENKLQAALLGKAEILEELGEKSLSLKAIVLAFEVSEKLREEYTYNLSKEQLQAESKALAELAIEKAYALWLKTKDSIYADCILMFSEKTKSRILFDELNAERRNLTTQNNRLLQQKIKAQQLLSYYKKQQQEKFDVSVQKKIADLEFQISSLQKRLNIKSPALDEDVRSTLKKIPEGKLAVIFFSGSRNTYLILAKRAGVDKIIKLGESERVEALVKNYLNTYFYNGPVAMANNPTAFYNLSYQVYQSLFSGINIKNQQLLIVKDGILNFLPFESLITSAGSADNINKWPFLIRFTEASYAFSLNSLLPFKNQTHSNKNRFTGLFLSKTGSEKNEIPAVAAEYNELNRIIDGRFLKDEEATVKSFTDALAKTDILHISSHSYLTDSLKEPVLELYKSRFYLLELNDGERVPGLVVLSACQTADGAYLSGEGVLSFSRGFIASGAKGVISSLWNVNDKSAAALMVNFYKNLMERGSTSGILYKTKRQWLNQKHKNQMMLLPYYWDSLIYTGQDFEVQLDAPWHGELYLIVIAALLLVGLIFYYFRKKKLNISPARS